MSVIYMIYYIIIRKTEMLLMKESIIMLYILCVFTHLSLSMYACVYVYYIVEKKSKVSESRKIKYNHVIKYTITYSEFL